jgi:hypothetical protein
VDAVREKRQLKKLSPKRQNPVRKRNNHKGTESRGKKGIRKAEYQEAGEQKPDYQRNSESEKPTCYLDILITTT